MLLCKQAEKDVPLQAEQADWLEDTDEEIDEQELEAHYSYMAKIQEVPTADLGTDTEPLEKTDQNSKECDDECAALANLIANLTLDTKENKRILKKLKKGNASLTQELKECKSNLEESNTTRDSCLIVLQNKQNELETYKTLIDYTVDYDRLELVKEKHDELVKQSFFDKVTLQRNQSIQTIHMLAPKGSTFNGRPTFANPMYLKKVQSEKPCLYEIPYDTSDLTNRFIPDREETLTLEKESRSKLNKDLVKPYDYTKQNKLVDQAWEKHSHDHFRAPTAHNMEILIKTCLMPLALKIQNDGFKFVHEPKQEMHADLKYVESFEKQIDDLESDKAKFSNMYDLLFQECVSNDVMCSYLHSLSDLDAHTELQCLYLHKVKKCDCLAQKLSKQTETVSKEVYNELS
ncbi:hypothetical protein Tco_1107728 [Tanacetum coccineum]